MKHISKYTHRFRLHNHKHLFYLSQLSFSKNNLSILHYSHYKHKFPLANHHTFSFSTSTKDDTKTEHTTDTIQSTDPLTDTTSDQALSTDDQTITPPPQPFDAHRPLIHIHDEERPQLSISLPNRWPFKRLARKPAKPSEPLNMHEMTTFSGLPAQNFMPTEADKAKTEAFKAQQKTKTKEEKKREARKKFWKRYTLILLLTPLILYVLDNRKAKKMATRRAEYVASATSQDSRTIRNMAQLNNAELIDLYYWILNEECDNDVNAAMTVDQFGELFVNAVNVFKKRKEANGGVETQKDIRLSREYDDELTKRDKKRELKWLNKKYDMVKEKRLSTKLKELQPWDLNIFFTEYRLPSSNTIPLQTLFIALSQISTDTLYNKCEVAFRIFTQQIQDIEPEITYNDLVELIDDMIITGHFTTDSLIVRRNYFPSQFGILTSEEICDRIYSAAELDKKASIKFTQFGEALMTLAEGRKFWEGCLGFFLPETYKPWLMVWYCSDRSRAEISEEKRKEERKRKRLEEKQKKMEAKLEKQREENMKVDSDNEGNDSEDMNVQTN